MIPKVLWFDEEREGVEVIKRDECCNKSPRNECLINGIKGIHPHPTIPPPGNHYSFSTHRGACTLIGTSVHGEVEALTESRTPSVLEYSVVNTKWITLPDIYGFNWNKPLKQPGTSHFAWLQCFMKAGLQYHGWFHFKLSFYATLFLTTGLPLLGSRVNSEESSWCYLLHLLHPVPSLSMWESKRSSRGCRTPITIPLFLPLFLTWYDPLVTLESLSHKIVETVVHSYPWFFELCYVLFLKSSLLVTLIRIALSKSEIYHLSLRTPKVWNVNTS